MQNKYIYAYLDTRIPGPFEYLGVTFSHQPFYVGKGQGRRWREHIRLGDRCPFNPRKGRRVEVIRRETGLEPLVVIVRDTLTNDEANRVEASFIKAIGRHDLSLGPLLNLTDGGDGANNISVEGRARIRASKSGSRNPNFGGGAMSDRHVSKIPKQGELNPFFGKSHSAETKAKIAAARLAESRETKSRRSVAFRATRESDPSKWCKTYEFTSPTGKVHVITNGMTAFCKEHGLNQPIISQMLRDKEYRPTKGGCVGWSVRKVVNPLR